MICIYLIITFLIIDFLDNNKLRFAFEHVAENKFSLKRKTYLKNIFQSICLKVAPIVAAAGKVVGGAAKGGAAKGGGGMMSGGGGMLGKLKGTSGGLKQAAVSGVVGAIQGIKALKAKKQADASMPELVDPNQAGFLAELGQKRKSIDTGADFAAGMQAIDATNAGTNNALVQNSGGDVSGTIQSLLQSERVANDSKNQVLAQGQQQQMQYNSMYSNQLNDMAQRRLEIQLLRSQQKRAEWSKLQQKASSNIMGAIGGMVAPGKNMQIPSVGGGDDSTIQSTKPMQSLPQIAKQQVFSGSSTAAENSLPKAAQQSVFGSQGTSADPNILANVIKGFKK